MKATPQFLEFCYRKMCCNNFKNTVYTTYNVLYIFWWNIYFFFSHKIQ